MNTYKNILIVVDLSESSARIAERAKQLASEGAALTLLHVVEYVPLEPVDDVQQRSRGARIAVGAKALSGVSISIHAFVWLRRCTRPAGDSRRSGLTRRSRPRSVGGAPPTPTV